ncbi:hypothetical protein GCM10017690_06750 [Microbacterium terregens]
MCAPDGKAMLAAHPAAWLAPPRETTPFPHDDDRAAASDAAALSRVTGQTVEAVSRFGSTQPGRTKWQVYPCGIRTR